MKKYTQSHKEKLKQTKKCLKNIKLKTNGSNIDNLIEILKKEQITIEFDLPIHRDKTRNITKTH